ncbi:MAG: TonB-dependent receptor [Prolixibacteraceae bacterium]|jgi:TonB-linked SusC/RagA family outer membrane protein
MKLTTLLFFVALFQVSAISYSQTRINLKFEKESLESVFSKIEANSEFSIFYKNDLIKNSKEVSGEYKNALIFDILDQILKSEDLSYTVTGKLIMIVSKAETEQQSSNQTQKTVSGKVTDDKGVSLPGVSVVVKGTTNGTITDSNGKYELSYVPSNGILIFSFVGMKKIEISVEDKNTIDAVLQEETVGLDEVVAVGYGTMKKSDLTGAISSVSAQQLNTIQSSNVLGQAQGKLAGVDIVSSNGSPGSTQTIRIRGNRSINANNDPLFVVDGIPTTQGINDFNPGDIESMEILKDASAVAIYGSRGANGVILITTKRGKKGLAQISYNGYTGIEKQFEHINKMNSEQFVEYKRVAYGLAKNDNSQDQTLLGALYDNYVNGVGTDYLSETYRNGFQTNHQLSASGGNDKLSYYLSGSYFNEEGVLKKTDYERFSLRVNLDATLTQRINVGLSFTASKDLRNRMDDDDPTTAAIHYVPITSAYDDDGNIIPYPNPDESLTANPLSNFAPNQYIDETKGFRMFSNLFGEYKILKDLKYRLNVGTDVSYSRRGQFTGDYIGSTPVGSIDNSNVFSYTLENILTYNKNLGEHNFNVTGLYSVQSNSTETSSLSAKGIPITHSTFYALGTAETITGIGSGLTKWGLMSYMGRVNYKFKDRYLITVSGRTDGSSRLAEGNKWAFFPAASVGWIISEEKFLKMPVLSFLKLRGGYGSVGNTAINPYQTQGGLARSDYNFGDASAFGYQQDGIANPNLGWEISNTFNFGIDFGFFKNRISGNLEIYDTHTSDLLLQRLLPATSGFVSVIENVGSTRNRGWELTVSANVLNNGSGLKWDVDINLSSNKEQITELFNGTTDDIGNNWFIGHPINTFYDYVFDGIWQTSEADEAAKYGQAPGQIKIKDVNGRDENGVLTNKPDGQINSDDRAILGSAVPDWTGGITNTLSYKGFDFSMLIYARQGQMLNSSYYDLGGNNWEGRRANLNLNYWTPDNPSNEYPQPVQGKSILYSSALTYFDGSFIKLKNISLGYDFARNLIKSKALSSCRIYLSATNPITWSKYDIVDPETGGALSTSNYIIGLNVKF